MMYVHTHPARWVFGQLAAASSLLAITEPDRRNHASEGQKEADARATDIRNRQIHSPCRAMIHTVVSHPYLGSTEIGIPGWLSVRRQSARYLCSSFRPSRWLGTGQPGQEEGAVLCSNRRQPSGRVTWLLDGNVCESEETGESFGGCVI